MDIIKAIASALSLGLMMTLSGCGGGGGDSADPRTPAAITIADTYSMVLDVDKEGVSSDWNSSTSVTGNSVSIVTDGIYGNCVIANEKVVYTKTVETNATDSCVLSIDNTNYIKVNIDTLYWTQISATSLNSSGIKSDGTLWSWGYNANGQLGNNSTTHSSAPVKEATDSRWKSVSRSSYHTVAIKTDGTLWSWGQNANGQLGDNTIISKLTPVQEDSNSSTWSSVTAGIFYTVAIKTDGTLWSWGYNAAGQLGHGGTAEIHIPRQEDSNSSTWSSASTSRNHTVALKTDGTLWSWGNNYEGQLGTNSRDSKYTPTQESTGARDWKTISTGNSHTTAIKSDGTLWSWGQNNYGQLGNGTDSYTSPDEIIPTKAITRRSIVAQ